MHNTILNEINIIQIIKFTNNIKLTESLSSNYNL